MLDDPTKKAIERLIAALNLVDGDEDRAWEMLDLEDQRRINAYVDQGATTH